MYLLDTNALLIFLHDELTTARLKQATRELLEDVDDLYVSVISLWEIAIKVRIGKLALKESMSDVVRNCREQGIGILPVKTAYLDKTIQLELFQDHKDAFDRYIISTAIVEGMKLITTDEKIRSHDYGIEILW